MQANRRWEAIAHEFATPNNIFIRNDVLNGDTIDSWSYPEKRLQGETLRSSLYVINILTGDFILEPPSPNFNYLWTKMQVYSMQQFIATFNQHLNLNVMDAIKTSTATL